MKVFKVFLWSVLLCLPILGASQTYELPEGQKYQKIKFQLINNLIIIPVDVNGSELSFVLDSGVNKPILFNITDQDSLQINNVSEITIRGLGEGEPIKALSSRGNAFNIKSIKNQDQLLYVVLDKSLNFSTSLGIPIHGIIGYDLFRDFVVDINYNSKTIKFHDPEHYAHKSIKKGETLPLSIIKKKAYVEANVFLEDSENVPVRLLVDTGSSDAIWLFEDDDIEIPKQNYEDYLGMGLSGNIFGRRTKVNSIKIGSFALRDAKAAFPDKKSFGSVKNLGNRNGSVGGEVLKRFNIVFDYTHRKITLRKNGMYKNPFHYNLSGITLQHDGVRYVSERITDGRGVVRENNDSFGNVQILFENNTRLSLVPEIVVSGIRAGSPAENAGLKEGDVILAVNGKSVHQYKIQEIMHMLDAKEGKRVRVLIERYNRDLLFSFVLENMFNKKSPDQ
ncbi:aspartyl protease family protein [Maribacter sp. HTCC2170]|uniref:aspartyl protease family protein n=1 Tax=Maribacter sp. (strain HTCC2170 / KCCM 42371) TaxID=313603 RepID=UPI00006B1AB1|nr:aspartyl protease family protein [Maribacter sp. HTCC2170]EAR00697.1 aspartate aminotransferase [Maribacter sp. HTCC2170]